MLVIILNFSIDLSSERNSYRAGSMKFNKFEDLRLIIYF